MKLLSRNLKVQFILAAKSRMFCTVHYRDVVRILVRREETHSAKIYYTKTFEKFLYSHKNLKILKKFLKIKFNKIKIFTMYNILKKC